MDDISKSASEYKSEDNSQDNFGCRYSSSFPAFLLKHSISLAFTSYQASRVCFLRAANNQINLHLRAFPRPMGIYADEERITLGTFSEVIDFRRSQSVLDEVQQGVHDNDARLSRKLKEKAQQAREIVRLRKNRELEEVKQADALYLPRASHYSGMINIHDIAWGKSGLWVVNSTFSCLSTLSPDSSFVARWKPWFISELVPEDRCHVNGMSLRDGEPRYVTTFNQHDHMDSWSQSAIGKGTLIDIEDNRIILDNLTMPHSPRYHNGYVYVCNSGNGTVLKVNPDTGVTQTILELPGFTRGISFYKNYMFVGTSKTRKSEVREQIPLLNKYDTTQSGVWVYNFDTNAIVDHLIFDDSLEQIYDIAVIPECTVPELVSPQMVTPRHMFEVKDAM